MTKPKVKFSEMKSFLNGLGYTSSAVTVSHSDGEHTAKVPGVVFRHRDGSMVLLRKMRSNELLSSADMMSIQITLLRSNKIKQSPYLELRPLLDALANA